jgi:hypothetical protein
MFPIYEQARFARLCSYLRRREPNAEVNYSILIYRLSRTDLQRALEGPPVELFDEPFAGASAARYSVPHSE